jgi:transposase
MDRRHQTVFTVKARHQTGAMVIGSTVSFRRPFGSVLTTREPGVGRTQTVIGMFYRRIKSRIGGKGAVTATAHKLAVLIYRMLSQGTEYVATALAEYEAKMKAQQTRLLQKKAVALDYQIIP